MAKRFAPRGPRGVLNSKKRKVENIDEEISSDSEQSVIGEKSFRESDEGFEDETPHERHVRLTKKALAKALRTIGSDEEDATGTLSFRLQEEALQARGKLFYTVADKVCSIRSRFMMKFNSVSVEDIICLRGHKKSVNCICISADCEYLYSGGKDATIYKWSLKNFSKVMSVCGGRKGSSSQFHTGPILSITISDDFKYLASGSADNSIIVWDPDNLDVMFRLRRHVSAVSALSFRRQSHMLFSGDRSGRICVWNMPLTNILQDQGAATKIEVLSISALSTERCVSSSGFGGAGICLWKVEEEVCVQYTVKDPSELSIECVYAVNDDLFVGGSTSNTLYLWHMSRGSPITKICPAHPPVAKYSHGPQSRPAVNWVTTVSGLFGTDLIASGSTSGHVQLWRIVVEGKAFTFGCDSSSEEPKPRGRLRIHHDTAKVERIPHGDFQLGGYVNSLAFSNDGNWLVAGIGQEHRLGRWNERRKVNDVVCLIPINIPFKQASELWT